ncbi:hypothetical protein [Brevibacillus laterosporus]|uniref:hypothetical protein n=1 Tax=Brevibacillus laterosporus TaxID=1465 RepID=UPI0024061E0C|nr:hypothetical protein [Brevibacillus laterosporus]
MKVGQKVYLEQIIFVIPRLRYMKLKPFYNSAQEMEHFCPEWFKKMHLGSGSSIKKRQFLYSKKTLPQHVPLTALAMFS